LSDGPVEVNIRWRLRVAALTCSVLMRAADMRAAECAAIVHAARVV